MRNFSIAICLQLLVGLPTMAEDHEELSCRNLVGVWENTGSRTLTIESLDTETGAIRGYYQLPPAIDPYKYSLSGWYNSLPKKPKQADETAISFSVQWGEFSSISSWIGTCTEKEGQPQLNLIWHQARLNSAQKNERISTGFDVFQPK